MTDLLENPDTGEIPAVDPGPDTRNLAPYEMTGPALRLYATGEQPAYAPETIGVVDEPRPEPAAVLALVDGLTAPPNPDRGEPTPMPIPGPKPPTNPPRSWWGVWFEAFRAVDGA
jgi:hypothetical protein